MTFGVDQCRRCGVTIPRRPLSLKERNTLARVTLNPPKLMAETEWRAAGYLAQPTALEMSIPTVGLCVACGSVVPDPRRRSPKRALLFSALAIAALVATCTVVSLKPG
jgi:hypothetical protein